MPPSGASRSLRSAVCGQQRDLRMVARVAVRRGLERLTVDLQSGGLGARHRIREA